MSVASLYDRGHRPGRATSFHDVYGDMTDKRSVDFLRRPKLASRLNTSKIPIDNGPQFKDRFADQKRGAEWQPRLGCGSCGIACRASSGSARANCERKTWLSGLTNESTSCYSRPALIAELIWRRLYELFRALHPSHCATRHRKQNTNSCAQRMAQ
jgi:hypothetical protein